MAVATVVRPRRGRTRVLPYDSQIEAVHLAVLPTGKILYYSGFRAPLGEHTETRLWQPGTGEIRDIPTPADIFCAGHSITPSGSLLSTGGTLDYGKLPSRLFGWLTQRILEPLIPPRIQDPIVQRQGLETLGITGLFLFDKDLEQWRHVGEMRHGRWYPTTCVLPDGGILILSGRNEARGRAGWREVKSIERRVHDRDPLPLPPELMFSMNLDVEVFYERGVGGRGGAGAPHATAELRNHGAVHGPGVRSMDMEAMKYGGHTHMFPTEYPRLHVLPLTGLGEHERMRYRAGRVFCSGYGPETKMLNLADWTWTHVDDLRAEHPRHDGNCVLLPLDPQHNYSARVLTFGGSRESALRAHAMQSTEIIYLDEANPHWRVLAPGEGVNVQPRVNGAAVLLPDGNIMAAGGNRTARWNDAVTEVDVFDSSTLEWSADHMPLLVPRGYHATAVLLPDARVLISGTTPAAFTQLAMEVYSPYYLYTDADEARDGWGRPVVRPRISSVTPAAVGYGANVTVCFHAGERPVSRAALMRPGAMTHAFDMDQRHVWLQLDVVSDRALVTMPPDAHVAPPGYYMLFLLDVHGTPSEAAWVRLG